ncbi:hypothetical protein J5E57_00245 [Streptococcus pneumoniae]|nr:hypothetical protein [Streptococcus pneumoniae]
MEKVDRDRLKNYIETHPDAYLTEIASEFGCHPTTIHYALKAMGYTLKKSRTYCEQDPEKVNRFLKELNHLSYLTPIYIYETGVETYFYLEYDRALSRQLVSLEEDIII